MHFYLFSGFYLFLMDCFYYYLMDLLYGLYLCLMDRFYYYLMDNETDLIYWLYEWILFMTLRMDFIYGFTNGFYDFTKMEFGFTNVIFSLEL